MKTRASGRLRLVAMAVVILLSPCARADSAVHYIPTQGDHLWQAVVDNDWVAWLETYQGSLCNIYAHNLVSGETRDVLVDDPATPGIFEGTATTYSWATWHAQIGISNSTIVYADRGPDVTAGQMQIRSYNLDTGVSTTVSGNIGRQNDFPAIDGDRVVWDYYSYRMYTARIDGSERRTLSYGNLLMGDISGDVVVWRTLNAPGSTILYRDLVTGANGVAFVSNEYQNPRPPAIDGNIIAWSMRDLTDSIGNIVSIMAYDISTGELITVKDHTGSPEHRSMVAVSGDWIVWEDWRNGNQDIYGYNLAKHEEVAIATGWTPQIGPSIDGDIVVWSEPYRGQIGWARLSELAPGPEPASVALLACAAMSLLHLRRSRG